jgi:hypothetical protein
MSTGKVVSEKVCFVDPAEMVEWHGLLLRWNAVDKRFDNFEQQDRWANAAAYPQGRNWSADLRLRGSAKLEIIAKSQLGPTPESALDAAAAMLMATINDMRAQIEKTQ